MTDLHPHLRLAVAMNEIDDALPGGGLRVIPDAGAARSAMRASGAVTQLISVITSAAPPRPRAV
jgi:hypothetical protein